MSVNFKLKKIGGKTYIYDIARKKYVLLTPEEIVRQSVLHLLIKKKYPLSLIRLEHVIKVGHNDKRTDITVFSRDGKVFMIIECKAPSENLTEKTITQISVYNSVLDARYLVVTNGKKMFVFKRNSNEFYEKVNDIPNYNSI